MRNQPDSPRPAYREWIGRGTMLVLGLALLIGGVRLLVAARAYQVEDREFYKGMPGKRSLVHPYLYFVGSAITLAGAGVTLAGVLPLRLMQRLLPGDAPADIGREQAAFRILRRFFR